MGSDLPALVIAADAGDATAAEKLFELLYAELHRVARRELARGGGLMSLGATTLLHETYLAMAAREGTSFPDRPRFLGYAARVMRGLIVDHVRRRRALKRGGQFEITALPTDVGTSGVDERELEAISQALDCLAEVEPALAEVVDLKFFCGFSFAEIGALKGVAERTVQRQWGRARIYLHRAIRAELPT